MASPTKALLWAIWRQHRMAVWAIAVMTTAGWLLHAAERRGRLPGVAPDPSPLVELLAMFSFLLLVGLFGYLDSSADKGIGQFPRRLFTLPVSSLRLVAVPVLGGIAAVELFYAVWREPLSRGEPGSAIFTAVLLAAFMVCFQTVLWTLNRAGALRIVIAGAVAILLFVVSLLPSFPPAPPPLWRTEAGLSAIVAALAIIAFLVSWRHVARLRTGGGSTARWFDLIADGMAQAWPARRGEFSSPAAACFWFEWRSAGAVLPVLVGGVIVIAIGPLLWAARDDPSETLRLLMITLATPLVLAIPVGMAASKARFWSEDLSVPPFVAVRPVAAEDIVAAKVTVAALSAAAAWLVVMACVAAWLSLWGNLDGISRVEMSLRAFHGESTAAVYGLAALVVTAGMFLTWRLLVSRLPSGLSGSRRWFIGSILAIPLAAIAALVFDASRLLDWVLADPQRLTAIVWTAVLAVVAKYAFAVHAWRGIAARQRRAYLLVWLAGTSIFTSLGVVLWRMASSSPPLNDRRALTVVILLALLIVPLGRIGFATSRLARNRHR